MEAVRAARYDSFPQTAAGVFGNSGSSVLGIKFMQAVIRSPFMITENGIASADWVGVDGKVHDQARVDLPARYLGAYKRAAEDGVDPGRIPMVRNGQFQWAYGYSQKIRTNIQTTMQKRDLEGFPHISTKYYPKQTEEIIIQEVLPMTNQRAERKV